MKPLSKSQILFITIILLFTSPVLHAQNPDINLLREINVERNPSLDPEFRGVTHSLTPFVIGTPVLLYGLGMIKKDSLTKQNAIYIGASLFTSSVLTLALKYSVKRPRPYLTYPSIVKEAKGGSPSFPSGHTSGAFALATSLSLDYPKWYIITPAFLWAGTVAYSRMDLGVHYPSDVLVGAIIGSGSAWLCYKINKKLRASR